MKFSITVLAATLAATAMAAPGYAPPGGNNGNNGGVGNGNGNGVGNGAGSGNNNGGSCAGGQIVQCCNTGNTKTTVRTGLFGIFNNVIQPGQCVPIIGVFNRNCGANVAQCCNNSQTGIININVGQCVAFPF